MQYRLSSVIIGFSTIPQSWILVKPFVRLKVQSLIGLPPFGDRNDKNIAIPQSTTDYRSIANLCYYIKSPFYHSDLKAGRVEGLPSGVFTELA